MQRPRSALALVLLVAFTIPLSAHFALVRSVPSAKQALSDSPRRVQTWFSQAPAAGVSQLTLTSGETKIALDKTVIDKDKSMYADVPTTLAPGAYTLTWRAAGDDGHVMTGSIPFTIAPKTH